MTTIIIVTYNNKDNKQLIINNKHIMRMMVNASEGYLGLKTALAITHIARQYCLQGGRPPEIQISVGN